jgi:hypothetical protein
LGRRQDHDIDIRGRTPVTMRRQRVIPNQNGHILVEARFFRYKEYR